MPSESSLSYPPRAVSFRISQDWHPPWKRTFLRLRNPISWVSLTISVLCPESIHSEVVPAGVDRSLAVCSAVSSCPFGHSQHEVHKCDISINCHQLSWDHLKLNPPLYLKKCVLLLRLLLKIIIPDPHHFTNAVLGLQGHLSMTRTEKIIP